MEILTDDEYRKIFHKKLNYYMKKEGKTQADLIKDLGFSSSTISNWCTGLKLPRMGKIQLLADYFGIRKTDLIEDNPIPEQSSVHNTKKDLTCIIKEEFGERAEKVLNLFLKLDEIDQARIIERIETYLESEKYSSEEGYKHA